MSSKRLGILSLVTLVLTALWLTLYVRGLATAGPISTFRQALNYVNGLEVIFYVTYANAALVTVSCVVLFVALHLYYKARAPEWSAIGSGFVPIYGAMNLTVYLSQVTVVPRLLDLQGIPEYEMLSTFLLRQAIQQWPDSAVFIILNLGYAILGVPSIIFGILMLNSGSLQRLGGFLLCISGIASIAGFIGLVAQTPWLSQGSLISGVLFLLALVPMSWAFLRGRA